MKEEEIDKNRLMHYIDGVYNQSVSREQIEEKVDEYTTHLLNDFLSWQSKAYSCIDDKEGNKKEIDAYLKTILWKRK